MKEIITLAALALAPLGMAASEPTRTAENPEIGTITLKPACHLEPTKSVDNAEALAANLAETIATLKPAIATLKPAKQHEAEVAVASIEQAIVSLKPAKRLKAHATCATIETDTASLEAAKSGDNTAPIETRLRVAISRLQPAVATIKRPKSLDATESAAAPLDPAKAVDNSEIITAALNEAASCLKPAKRLGENGAGVRMKPGAPVGTSSEVPVTNANVKSAAEFAIKAQAKKLRDESAGPERKLELLKILSAKQQTVSGLLFQLELLVKIDGKERAAKAVVLNQAWAPPPQLLEWNWIE